MSKPLIELISNKSGDWEILRVNEDIEMQGHSINNHMWCDLLRTLGFEVERKEISDEEMEELT